MRTRRLKFLGWGADGRRPAPGAAQQVALFAVVVYLGYFGAAAGSGRGSSGGAGGAVAAIVSLCGIGLAVRLGLITCR